MLFLNPWKVLLQDMQSLQSVGTDVPARLVVDRVRLYTAEAMRGITANQGHVHEVQTQYTDALEDWVKSVFVRGIEDAIAARDAWHHDKVTPSIHCTVFVLQRPAGADGYHSTIKQLLIISAARRSCCCSVVHLICSLKLCKLCLSC